MAKASILPPPEYDHEFRGQLFVTENLTQAELRKLCDLPKATELSGCTHVPGTHGLWLNQCVILIAPQSDLVRFGYTIEDVKRHEIAHCNGWRHPVPKPPGVL